MTETFEVLGQMTNASNATLLVRSDAGQYIYKPISGERPLWDFQQGTLAQRERAAYVLSELLGWHLVPRTRLMDGPMGLGSVQDWVDADVSSVDIFPINQVPNGWLTVITGRDEDGKDIELAHSEDSGLRQVALFDVLINNADRKASHILTTGGSQYFVIDHGVTFHHEPKIRTVLWGWIGSSIPSDDLLVIENTLPNLRSSELPDLLAENEIAALEERFTQVLRERIFPPPSPEWPAIPWPIF